LLFTLLLFLSCIILQRFCELFEVQFVRLGDVMGCATFFSIELQISVLSSFFFLSLLVHLLAVFCTVCLGTFESMLIGIFLFEVVIYFF